MGGEAARVLVVDGERFFREGIREVLAGAGYHCSVAASGEEALELCEDPELGVALVDLRLPGMDALELLRRLRARHPGLRALVLAPHNEQERVLEALRLGACGQLSKPLHDEELVLAVGRAQEAHRLTRAAARLHQRLSSLESRMGGLADLAAILDGSDGAEVLWARAAEAAADVLRADKTALLLLDGAGAELRVAGATGRKLALPEFDAVPVGQGLAGRVFAGGEARLLPDLAADAELGALARGGDRYDSRSCVLAPLRVGDRALGLLCAADPLQRAAFDEEDLALLRTLALLVAQLVDPEARLPVAPPAESPAPEPPSADPDAELARAVCEAVTAELEPERLLEAALRPVARALGSGSAAVFLREATSGELVRAAQSAAPGGGDRERLPAGRGLTGTVLETGRPVATGEPQADPRFDPAVDTPAGGAAGPLLCLPLVFRGRSLGVFRAFPAEPGRASARTGEVLGAALSAALRSALLYRTLVESSAEAARLQRESRARHAAG